MTQSTTELTTATAAFADAVREAEALIANPPFDATEAELAEGFDYLAGSIRSAIQMAFDYDLAYPIFVNPTHQYARQGLDNPDAVYFHANLAAGARYLVTGRRGTSVDLSFQIMDGTYSADGAPSSVVAFDDRELEIGADGTFEWRFGPELNLTDKAQLIVREVFDDWNLEERGTLRIQRLDTAGVPRPAVSAASVAKRYHVAAKALVGRIHTWFAFPQWFTYKEPVNTLTMPAATPGGLASQFSSLGHYELDDDQAMVVTVPVSSSPYQAIQIGSRWYVSTDYEHHQTSLNKSQSVADPDGKYRYVISKNNPGIANWLETLGHRHGIMMLRWQRVAEPLGEDDGPAVEVMPFDQLAQKVPYFNDNQIDASTWAARIEARQVGIARRMIS